MDQIIKFRYKQITTNEVFCRKRKKKPKSIGAVQKTKNARRFDFDEHRDVKEDGSRMQSTHDFVGPVENTSEVINVGPTFA